MKKAFLLIGIVMVLLPYPILSQWSNDTQVNTPVCTEPNDQYTPVIASDGAGGAIIAWYDFRNGNSDIYARRINSSGTALWTADGVAICVATDTQENALIASDGSGGAIIAWYDFRNGNSDIYAQRINSSGAVLWTANGVAICDAANDQFDTQVMSDGAGGAFIVWADDRVGYDIYAQRINSSGEALWAANGVAICDAANGQRSPQLMSDGAGGAIIVWKDFRSGNSDIYAQRINSSGAVLWTANGVAICNAANAQSRPQLTSDGSGGSIITWEDARNDDGDIYAQRVNSSGAALWTGNGVAICNAAEYQTYPNLTSDGSGGAIIVWEDYSSLGGFCDIYSQRVNSFGTTLWTANGITICDAAYTQEYPRIASDGSGGAIISWYDNRSGNNNVYAQRVNSLGENKWLANGLIISNAANDKYIPEILGDGSGGAIISWYDNRSGNSDIYAQYTGVLVAPSPSDSDGDGVGDSDENAGPNYGDGNADFFRDADQAHIVPIVSWDGSTYVVIDGGQGGTSFTPKNIESEGPGVPFDKDMNIFPLGMTSFRLEGSAGFSKVVRIYYWTDIALSDIEGFKWYCKSAPDYDKYEWHEIPADNGSYGIVGTGEGTASGSHYIYVDVRLTDNAFGDSNPIAGIIDDPIAPYYSGAVVPSIGEFGGVALILSLLTLGGWIIIRRIV